jgi:amino acid adenylation domain-containing protein
MEAPVAQGAEEAGFPLSPRQRRLWELVQADGEGPYRVACAIRPGEAVDRDALAAALAELAGRYEVLRTGFRRLPGLKVPVQVIRDEPAALALAELPEPASDDAEGLLDAALRHPFDLASGAPLAAFLGRAGGGELLVLVLTSLCADRRSLDILVEDLAAGYSCRRGRPVAGAVVDEEPLQCADLAEWQNELLEDETAVEGAEHWRRLSLADRSLRLPVDDAAAAAVFAPSRPSTALAAGLGSRLSDVAAELGVRERAALFAAWQILLERWAGEASPVSGCRFAGRGLEQLDRAVAPLATVLPVPLTLGAGATGAEAIRAAETALGEAERWQQTFTWERLGAPPRFLPPHLPLLFDADLEAGPAPVGPWEVVARREVAERFAIRLGVRREAGDLRIEVCSGDGLLDAGERRRLAAGYVATLTSLLQSLERPVRDVDVLSAEELRAMSTALRGPQLELPERALLHALFAERAERAPQGAAVVAAETEWTAAELLARTHRLAHHLIALGAGPEVPVAVALERSPEWVTAVLAVLSSGAAFVPLDPGYPPSRLALMLELSGSPLLITDEALRDRFPRSGARVLSIDGEAAAVAARPPTAPEVGVSPDNLAYVLFTSGSTGRPKAVSVTHRAAVNHMLWMVRELDLGEGERIVQRTPTSFDASLWEVFVPLLAGSPILLDRSGNQLDPESLLDLLAERRATALQVVPSMLRVLLDEPAFSRLPHLERLFCGGEALPRDLVERSFAAGRRSVVNLYGPTETTIDATFHPCRRGGQGPVPIGRPIANVHAVVVDRRGGPAPSGAPGELWLGGAGLARGYLGAPAATAAAFVPDAWSADPGARLYRTGDLVRLRRDGELEFLGRTDDQVKLRGFRIELGEVASALCRHPGVREAVAVVRGEAPAQRLVAYWTAAQAEGPGLTELRAHLARELPEPMVPAALVRLDLLPLAPNGKLDRSRLPEPAGERPELAQEMVAPRDLDEELLATIWSEVLELDQIGIRDNVFALGNDSIRSVRVVALARERGLDLSLQMLFQHQCVEEQVRAIRRGGSAADLVVTAPFELLSEADRARLPDGVEDAYPLTGLQHGMLFHMEVDPSAPLYHNVTGYKIRGAFHQQAFQRAVDAAVARYPVLRTGFDLTGFGEPLQLVHRQASLPVGVRDLRHRSAEEQDALTDELVERERGTPFDLSRPPLLRFVVHRLTDDVFWFVLTECHSILDGWSLTSILREVFSEHFRLAAGAEPQAARPPEIAFRDYVALERRSRHSEESRRFWEEQLAGAELLRLPRRRSAFRAGAERIANHPVALGAELGGRLMALARRSAVPLKSVCLAAHVKALALISGRDDVLTGLPTNGRPDHPDAERLRGLFINTVPFRLGLDRVETWADLIREAFETERRLMPHRRFPLDEMRRNWKDRPLFEVLFSYVHFHHFERLLTIGEMEFLDEYKGWEANNFTLMVGFNRHPPDLELKMRLYFDPQELGREQVAGYGECLTEILAEMAERPDEPHAGFHPHALGGEAERELLARVMRVADLDEDFTFGDEA